jgi:uncharacterized integral membrane protein
MDDSIDKAAQRATLEFRVGRGAMLMSVEVTPAGLLAIGALVSGILLSTAVLVHTAKSAAGRARTTRNDVTRR